MEYTWLTDQFLKGKQILGGGKLTNAKINKIPMEKDNAHWKNGKYASAHNNVFENHL